MSTCNKHQAAPISIWRNPLPAHPFRWVLPLALPSALLCPILALELSLELNQGGTKVVLHLADVDVCGARSATLSKDRKLTNIKQHQSRYGGIHCQRTPSVGSSRWLVTPVQKLMQRKKRTMKGEASILNNEARPSTRSASHVLFNNSKILTHMNKIPR
jgi:hypothetical protein